MFNNFLFKALLLFLLFHPSLCLCDTKENNQQKISRKIVFNPYEKCFQMTPFQILKELEVVLPKSILVRQIDLKLGKPDEKSKLTVSGYAKNSDEVFKVIQQMNSSKIFKKTSLNSTEEVPVTKKTFYNQFQIESEIENPELQEMEKKEINEKK